MAKRADKAIIIGFDAPIVPRLYRFCKEGHLPNMNRLFIERGVWAQNCLVPLPTVTPPNWAAIATGAWPSTVHITDFNVHVPGDELNQTHQGFFSDDVHAETIYEALARAGKKSILLNYPSTWPPKTENSIVIGGASLHINSWSRRVPFAGLGAAMVDWAETATLISYSGSSLYSTQEYRMGTVIKFQEGHDWRNISGGRALAAEMPLTFVAPRYRLEPVTWHVLVQDGKALVCRSKDVATAMVALAEGQWSPVIATELRTEQGPRKAVFRMKLLELSPDAQRFRLFLTNLAATDGWSHPAFIAAEIESKEGLPGPGMSWAGYERNWYGLDTVADIERMETVFFADAAVHLLQTKPWHLFLMHAHAPDHLYHAISNALDNPDPVARKPFEETELAIYRNLDEMCGRIFSCADARTVMALVSDHGAKPTTGRFGVNRILQERGLLVRDKNRVVDWSKTRAIGEGAVHIWINLKGRDPHGVVESADYRKVQDEIINCLYDYKDPETGKRPVVLALRKEDARFIGLHGDWVGDIIYGISGDFGAQHAPQVPTAQYGIGDLRGLFALSGPNIRHGVALERTVWIQDMVPTICYIAGWPIPREAEGAVVFQALQDPTTR